jgi:hypothetical protein
VQVAENQERAVVWLEMARKQVAEGEQLEVVALTGFGSLYEPLESATQSAASTECRERTIARDAEQPRFGVAYLVELITKPNRLIEGVLQQILGERSVADHLSEEAAEALLAGPEKVLDLLVAMPS